MWKAIIAGLLIGGLLGTGLGLTPVKPEQLMTAYVVGRGFIGAGVGAVLCLFFWTIAQ